MNAVDPENEPFLLGDDEDLFADVPFETFGGFYSQTSEGVEHGNQVCPDALTPAAPVDIRPFI